MVTNAKLLILNKLKKIKIALYISITANLLTFASFYAFVEQSDHWNLGDYKCQNWISHTLNRTIVTEAHNVLDKLITQARKIIPTATHKPYKFELSHQQRKSDKNKAWEFIELTSDEKKQIENKVNETYAQKAKEKNKELFNLVLDSTLSFAEKEEEQENLKVLLSQLLIFANCFSNFKI